MVLYSYEINFDIDVIDGKGLNIKTLQCDIYARVRFLFRILCYLSLIFYVLCLNTNNAYRIFLKKLKFIVKNTFSTSNNRAYPHLT